MYIPAVPNAVAAPTCEQPIEYGKSSVKPELLPAHVAPHRRRIL